MPGFPTVGSRGRSPVKRKINEPCLHHQLDSPNSPSDDLDSTPAPDDQVPPPLISTRKPLYAKPAVTTSSQTNYNLSSQYFRSKGQCQRVLSSDQEDYADAGNEPEELDEVLNSEDEYIPEGRKWPQTPQKSTARKSNPTSSATLTQTFSRQPFSEESENPSSPSKAEKVRQAMQRRTQKRAALLKEMGCISNRSRLRQLRSMMIEIIGKYLVLVCYPERLVCYPETLVCYPESLKH